MVFAMEASSFEPIWLFSAVHIICSPVCYISNRVDFHWHGTFLSFDVYVPLYFLCTCPATYCSFWWESSSSYFLYYFQVLGKEMRTRWHTSTVLYSSHPCYMRYEHLHSSCHFMKQQSRSACEWKFHHDQNGDCEDPSFDSRFLPWIRFELKKHLGLLAVSLSD